MTCPFCNSSDTSAEFVDNGVGMEQVTPYHCNSCNAYQLGSELLDPTFHKLSEVERRVGWPSPTSDFYRNVERPIDLQKFVKDFFRL